MTGNEIPGGNPSWNPLRLGGTALPVPVLLMVKLIALSLLLTGYLPAAPAPRAIFLLSAAALLLNRPPRLSSLILGATVLADRMFCGLLLVVAGLYENRLGPWLLRLPLVLAYFGISLNQLPDPGWQSGLGAAFLIRRLWPYAIWGSLLLQAALLEFTGSTSAMFYGMQAALLAFVAWPDRITVIYDGNCGICNKIRRWWERADFERAFEWIPYQSGAGARWGIAEEALKEKLHLVADGGISSGFRACKRMLLYQPVTYFVIVALIALHHRTIWLFLAFFFPLFEPVGEAVYNWVARNRYRLSGEGACTVEAKQ